MPAGLRLRDSLRFVKLFHPGQQSVIVLDMLFIAIYISGGWFNREKGNYDLLLPSAA